MPLLLVEKGRDRGTSHSLDPAGECLIGREPGCHLRLKDPMTSRRHFRVRGDGTRFSIEDLGSRNGTYLNGKKVLEDFIQIEDKVQVGETIISFLRDSASRRKGPLTGKALGGYLFQERVGRGGMGTVYRARQISLDRQVAVKVLSPELTKNQAFVDLFIREARAAGRLAHPHVVEVYDVVAEEGINFYSMEMVEGGSVEELLSRQGPIDPRRALEITRDAARALEYAEKNRVIHRDVKPDNLMITSSGRVKICDLGIAKTHGEGGAAETEGISGSPHYMAPEQATGLAIDHRVDIYSLGVSLYEMLTAETPFEAPSQAELIRMHIREAPPAIRSLRPEVPRSVVALVDRMMAKRPSDRFANATDLAEEVGRILRSLPGPGPVPSGSERVAAAVGRRLRPSWLITWLILPMLLLVAATVHSSLERQRARDRSASLHRQWRGEDLQEAWRLVGEMEYEEAEAIAERLQLQPGTKEGREATHLLAEIERRRTKERDLADGRAALEEVLTWSQEHPEDLRGLRSRLEEIVSLYPLEEIREEVAAPLEEVDRKIREEEDRILSEGRRLEEEKEAVAWAVAEVQSLVEAGEFQKAFRRVEELRQTRPTLVEEADILDRRVRDAAWDAYRAAESEAKRLRGEGRLDEAATWMRSARASAPLDEIRDQADTLLAAIEQEAKDVEAKRKAKQDSTDSADWTRFESSTKDAADLVREFRIREAIETLEGGKRGLSGTAYHQNYDWRIAHLKRIQAVLDRIREQVKDQEFPSLSTWHGGQRWKIVGAGEDGLTIRSAGSGEAEFLKTWDKVGWREIRRVCRQIGDLGARDHLNLYAFCREFQPLDGTADQGERRDAYRLMEGKDDPGVRQAFLDYEEGRW